MLTTTYPSAVDAGKLVKSALKAEKKRQKLAKSVAARDRFGNVVKVAAPTALSPRLQRIAALEKQLRSQQRLAAENPLLTATVEIEARNTASQLLAEKMTAAQELAQSQAAISAAQEQVTTTTHRPNLGAREQILAVTEGSYERHSPLTRVAPVRWTV